MVVPGDLASVEGNANNAFPFNRSNGDTMRYQQVYAASEFSGSLLINTILFRPDSFTGSAFSSTIPNIQIDLSTTSNGPDGLSTTFASNVGSDNTSVFSGSLSLSSTDAPGSGNTRAFDIVVNLSTPFFYDPSQGNLLLDVRNFGGVGTTQFDAVQTSSDSISRVLSFNVNSGTGLGDTLGLVTAFDGVSSVPEPSTLALLGMASLGMIGYSWQRKRKTTLAV